MGENDFLLDASEILVLDYVLQKKDFDVLKSVTDPDPDEEELKNEGLFYGVFKTYEPLEEMKGFMKNMIDYGLVKFNFECTEEPFKEWTSENIQASVEYSVIKDLVIFESSTKGCTTIPFAAYIKSENNLDTTSTFGATFFPKLVFEQNKEPDVFTSFLNRPGLFSIHTMEKRKKQKINLANWKEYIDKDRALKVASNIK